MKSEKWKTLRRVIVSCAGALYLAVVIGATVYSQTGYVESLPLVELITAEKGRVPDSALLEGADGLLLNYVEQQDGPWGKRYVLRQMTVLNYIPMEEGVTFVYEAVNLDSPIALSVSIPPEYVYDGMEVRLS